MQRSATTTDPLELAERLAPGTASAIRSFALPATATVRDFLVWHEQLERDFYATTTRARHFRQDSQIAAAYAPVARAVANSQAALRTGIAALLLSAVSASVRARVLAQIPSPPAQTLDKAPRSSGVGVAPIVVAGVILAVLAGLGLAFLLTRGFAELAHQAAGAYVARLRLTQFQELLNARERAYRECLSRGSPPSVCQITAQSIAPNPEGAGLELNTPAPPAALVDTAGSSLPWRLVLVVGAIGVAAYFLWSRGFIDRLLAARASGASGLRSTKYFGVRSPAMSSRQISPSARLRDTYEMEV